MYNKKLMNCFCGRLPKLRVRKDEYINGFVYYDCKCGRSTFATKEEIFSRELWNAAIERLEKIEVAEKNR